MQPSVARRLAASRGIRFVAGLCCAVACVTAIADIRVPSGATLRVGEGRIDYGGTSHLGYGVLQLGSGSLEGLDDFRILAGGSATLGSGSVSLAGDWENRGSINAGSSVVEFIDSSSDSQILGATTFSELRLLTAQGKRWRLESGQTQRVTDALLIIGSGAPVRIDVTTPAATAFLDLLAAGSQDIGNVAVWDVHATGQPLATDETNQGGNANTTGWFAQGVSPLPVDPVLVPIASPWSLLLMALAMLLLARHRVVAQNRIASRGK